MLTRAEINNRLHRFNLTNDWSVFDDVPPGQAVDVMYPSVFTLPNEDRKAMLNKLFGPLSEPQPDTRMV